MVARNVEKNVPRAKKWTRKSRIHDSVCPDIPTIFEVSLAEPRGNLNLLYKIGNEDRSKPKSMGFKLLSISVVAIVF